MLKAIFGLICAHSLICSATALTSSSDDQAARDAAMQWLKVVDSGKYDDAAQMMSQEIRGQRDWRSYLAKHRAQLGAANKRHLVEVKHRSTIPGAVDVRKYATVRFQTSFERGSLATEEVTMAKLSCCWEVFEYKVEELRR